MENKLTDKEIVKALECSVNGRCHECPYFHSYPCDKCRNMRKDVLDLINRSQAKVNFMTEQRDIYMQDATEFSQKVDRLEAENKAFGEIIKKQDDEISDLRKDLLSRKNLEESFSKSVKQFDKKLARTVELTKAEAYKECIEKVKEKSKKSEIVCSGALVTTSYLISAKNLNNLLKELAGEDK